MDRWWFDVLPADFICAGGDEGKSENQKFYDSAQNYLQAAQFYRTFDDAKSAIPLYSAVEAFLAGDYKSDAEEVAKILKNLYPDSRQAQRVDRLFEKTNQWGKNEKKL